jgi:hypothetical protein
MVGAYSVGELMAIIEEAGFKDVRLVAYLPKRGSGLITATKP